jgi:NTE family protein
MPQKQREPGVALALSGGGFRATLFHLGTLWRLNELKLLRGLKEITSVSGGSITSGWLGLSWNKLTFDASGEATNFVELIVDPLRQFCSSGCDLHTVIKGWLNPLRRPSYYLANHYRKALFGDATLQHLPSSEEGPRFTIYATNLQTGVSVRMTRKRLADYRIGEIPNPDIPLATAVAASSAFPPLYIPLKLEVNPSAWQEFEGADLFGNPSYCGLLYLGDGGIYDNMGLESIWDRYETVLMSDAGSPFQDLPKLGLARVSQISRLLRTLAIIDRQSRALRHRWFMRELDHDRGGDMKGTSWRIGTNIEDYPLSSVGRPGPMTSYNDRAKSLARIRTRLNCFTDQEQGWLINWGYALTDAALRSRVLDAGVPEGSWPVPEYKLT